MCEFPYPPRPLFLIGLIEAMRFRVARMLVRANVGRRARTVMVAHVFALVAGRRADAAVAQAEAGHVALAATLLDAFRGCGVLVAGRREIAVALRLGFAEEVTTHGQIVASNDARCLLRAGGCRCRRGLVMMMLLETML